MLTCAIAIHRNHREQSEFLNNRFLHAPFPSSATDGNQAMIMSVLAKSGCLPKECLHLNTAVVGIQPGVRHSSSTATNDAATAAATTTASNTSTVHSSIAGNGYTIEYSRNESGDDGGGSRSTFEHFDAVVIAAPLESARVHLHPPLVSPASREYVSVHTTVVTGVINGTFFGVPAMREGSLIMAPTESTLESDVHFVWNRGNVTVGPDVRSVYLLHSAEEIGPSQLAAMFYNVNNVSRHFWPAAYPREIAVATNTLPPIELAPGLFYTSAIESVASSMETSVLSSRNIAKLLLKRLSQH